jgi:hypothetical protein
LGEEVDKVANLARQIYGDIGNNQALIVLPCVVVERDSFFACTFFTTSYPCAWETTERLPLGLA